MRKLRICVVVMLLSMKASAKFETMYVGQYDQNQPNTLVLESRFSEAQILNPEVSEQLKGKQIHHIDLVYTTYRLADHFNQNGLNSERIWNLKKVLPQIEADKPTWLWVAQTDASTIHQAQNAFHGFVIYYSDGHTYEAMSEFFEGFQTKPNRYTASNEKGGTFTHASGTTIHLEPNSVVDAHGKPVQGDFEISYTEFRNAADIVYSGIPMTYNTGGTSYNFSSAGMYEIRAEQNGKELHLDKPISIDFNTTGQEEGVGFYQMDDETGEWKQLKEEVFEGNNEQPSMEELVERQPQEVEQEDELEGEDFWLYWTYTDHRKFEFPKWMWDMLKRQLKVEKVWDDRFLAYDDETHIIHIKLEDTTTFSHTINRTFANFDPRVRDWPIAGNANGTLLAENADRGHTYPDLVKGLNSEKFGVYNCDQIYRIGKPKTIKPKYVDASTGEAIRDQFVTCVIDLNYNGSFSFDPRNVKCNMEGKNVILLFTKDKKTYMLNADEFAALNLNKTHTPTMRMKNMTDQLKSSKDLSRLLNI